MAANGISSLPTKEARQKAKLALAKADRARVNNPRSNYNIELLPTQYDDNGIIDNANPDGLILGRPWFSDEEVYYGGELLEVAEGMWRTDYQGYFYDNPNFFATASLKAPPNNFNGPDTNIAEPSLVNNTSIQLLGYFKTTYTGTHTLYLASDDGSYMWFGDTAVSGFTTANATIANGGLHGIVEVTATVNLVAGEYIPLRVQFGNGPAGPGELRVSYSYPGQAKTSNWAGKIFYNTATNGL